jgi:hypothetical protein
MRFLGEKRERKMQTQQTKADPLGTPYDGDSISSLVEMTIFWSCLREKVTAVETKTKSRFLHCAPHDETVRRFGRNDDSFDL